MLLRLLIICLQRFGHFTSLEFVEINRAVVTFKERHCAEQVFLAELHHPVYGDAFLADQVAL